jgi:hypothetical protein
MILTKSQIAHLRKLNAERTQGEWAPVSDLPSYSIGCGDVDIFSSDNRRYRTPSVLKNGGAFQHDADFIAAAANSMSDLLDAAEENARLREALKEIALHGITRPLEEGEGDDGDGHWKYIAYSCMKIAARAALGEKGEG